MSVGTYISGFGHVGLVVWLIAGWGMRSEPFPLVVSDVTLVSGADFAAMSQSARPELPASPPEVPDQPAVVEETPPAPVAPSEETPPEVAPPPPQVEPPAAESAPVAPDMSLPDTDVTDTPPVVPDTPQIIAPPPSAELGTSPRPIPRPAQRVAPEAVAPPPPDTAVAPDVAQTATQPEEAPVVEEQPEVERSTSPEEAATEIVTEAETPQGAPEISSRPQARPNRPTPPAAAPETPAPSVAEAPAASAPTAEVDPVAAAIAEAAANAPAPTSAPSSGLSGGQLSEGDKSGFLRQIGQCWNTGTLSTGAQNTVIVMAFDMTPDGMPVSSSVRLESYSGGTVGDADAAFQTARRALINCARDRPYDLPRAQYEQWQRVLLTVDPEAMRNR